VSIDGVFQPNEWSDGTHLSFNWASNNSSLTGGGNIWVKTNGTDLLIAVGADGTTTLNAGSELYNYTLTLLFDTNNNGVINNNENAKSLGITYSSGGSPSATYRDLHYDSTLGLYVDNTNVYGTAAASHALSGSWSWEFAMPLSSSDFTFAQNASMGMDIVYSEQHYSNLALVSSGWAYWQVSYSSGYPTGTVPSADGWASIVWTNLNAPILDTTPPTISTPTITPASPGSTDTVMVKVNVTDTGSGVKNVSITYTTDNWKSVNKTLSATYNITSHYAAAQIPPLQLGGHVEYYVIAFDNAGNKAVNNNSGAYFSYDVSTWFASIWLWVILAVAAIVVAFAIIHSKRRHRSTRTAAT